MEFTNINILTTSLLVALFCNALHFATHEGNIFGFLRPRILKLPSHIRKPLISCPFCMAGLLYPTLYLLFTLGLDVLEALRHGPKVFLLFGASACMSLFVFELITSLISIRENIEAIEENIGG